MRNTSFVSGDTVTEMIVTPLSADGKIKLYANGSGFNFFVDIAGWYTAPTLDGSLFNPLVSNRLVDTASTTPVAVWSCPVRVDTTRFWGDLGGGSPVFAATSSPCPTGSHTAACG